MHMQFYEQDHVYRRIECMLDESGGEVTHEIATLLEQDSHTTSELTERACQMILEREAAAKALKEEIARLETKRAMHAKAAETLRGYLMRAMALRQVKQVDTGKFKATVCENGGKPKIWWAGHTDEPAEFTTTKTITIVDHDAIQAAYKAGTLPAGYQVERGTHLRIK